MPAGIGKSEPLKGDMGGFWSRRIEDVNRSISSVFIVWLKSFYDELAVIDHFHFDKNVVNIIITARYFAIKGIVANHSPRIFILTSRITLVYYTISQLDAFAAGKSAIL
ncbi:MAG: type II toxin-antitoxin system YoeB family toxin [Acetatifactor sp.]|nr:type II toxin-antitoxin system YoeB family toxin [Acetatifactor sp.]